MDGNMVKCTKDNNHENCSESQQLLKLCYLVKKYFPGPDGALVGSFHNRLVTFCKQKLGLWCYLIAQHGRKLGNCFFFTIQLSATSKYPLGFFHITTLMISKIECRCPKTHTRF